MINFELVS